MRKVEAFAKADHSHIIGAQTDGSGTFNMPCDTTTTISVTFGGRAFPIDQRDFVGKSIDNTGTRCLSRISGQDIHGKWLIGDVFL